MEIISTVRFLCRHERSCPIGYRYHIRKGGGDCDTLTCIAGAMAEAFYGVPEEMKKECRKRLPEDMLTVLDQFSQIMIEKNPAVS